MKIDVVVPEVGESITSGILSAWLKEDGQYVEEGEELYELETDKTTLAVPAAASGIIMVRVPEEEEVEVGQVVGFIEPSAEKPVSKKSIQDDPGTNTDAAQSRLPEVAAAGVAEAETGLDELSPAVRRIVAENTLDPSMIQGTGKNGRIIKEDALKAAGRTETSSLPGPGILKPGVRPDKQAPQKQNRVKMTGLRKKIAENLVYSKQSSAHLTTFNEIDMGSVIEMRKIFGEDFEKKHGVRLGFMSFFIKACQDTLAVYPRINAFIDGDDIVYNNFYDIGVALSTDKGLIAPVVRGVEYKSFSDIEKEILSFKQRAEEKKLMPDELSGATFTISNGGVFGSLMSTPIPGPGQTAILGMHVIQKRPVVVNDEITVKPMMYAALTYDHRIVDGREAIGFLFQVKKLIEDPRRQLLGL